MIRTALTACLALSACAPATQRVLEGTDYRPTPDGFVYQAQLTRLLPRERADRFLAEWVADDPRCARGYDVLQEAYVPLNTVSGTLTITGSCSGG